MSYVCEEGSEVYGSVRAGCTDTEICKYSYNMQIRITFFGQSTHRFGLLLCSFLCIVNVAKSVLLKGIPHSLFYTNDQSTLGFIMA